jgi:D-alanine transaminase
MILWNDRLIPESEGKVSYLDRGYCFGDGIYEVFRVYGGRLFEKELHLQRLERSAKEIRLELPYSLDRIGALLEQLVDHEHLAEGTLYMQITRGAAPRTHAFPPRGTSPVLLAYCSKAERPAAAIQNGVKVVTRPDLRWLRCDIKSLNLLGAVLAKQEALDAGCDEVILHRDGIVTECSASNVMIVKDGAVKTHPADHLILNGVTRQVVLRLADRLGIPAAESPFRTEELRAADEAFLTSTTMEITPIVEIDGHAVGSGSPGPVTRRLQEAFQGLIGR